MTSQDETEEVENRLFKAWIDAGRFQELIDYAHDEFELQDGEAFCASLGQALCKAKNPALAEQLFAGLYRCFSALEDEAAKSRVKSEMLRIQERGKPLEPARRRK